MHLKRWITAIIALPLLVALVYKGHPILFGILIGLVSMMALWEYFRIVYGRQDGKSIHPISGLGFAASLMIVWAAYIGTAELMIGALAVNLILSGLMQRFPISLSNRPWVPSMFHFCFRFSS